MADLLRRNHRIEIVSPLFPSSQHYAILIHSYAFFQSERVYNGCTCLSYHLPPICVQLELHALHL